MLALKNYKFLRDSERVSRDVILLILTTGLRLTEASTIQWKQINFNKKTILIPDTKNGRDHVVPMTPLTFAMLLYRREHHEDSSYVFRIKGVSKSGHITSFQKTLTNLCKNAEIPVVSAHDLRRTFATLLNTMNVGYADLKELMNHKAKDITAGVYIQPDIEKLRGILIQVVEYYDRKIPFYPPGQGCSRYASGTLRKIIYKTGTPDPIEIDDPTSEDPAWLEQSVRDFWNGH